MSAPTRSASDRARAGRCRFGPAALDGAGAAGGVLLLAIVAACLAAPWLTAHDPVRVDLPRQFEPPSLDHPLGTDHFGRDTLARLLYGGRTSLAVAAAATAATLVVSVVLGAAAGYAGGRIDGAVSSLIDVTLAFPRLVLAIAIAGLLGSGLVPVAAAIVAVSWAWYARIVRGLVRQARAEAYVVAARALGATTPHLLRRHLLPAVAGPVAVLVSLDFGHLILGVSALTFLGLGVQPPAPEWGALLNESRLFFAQAPELMLYPGLAIFLTVLACNVVGDALHAALDPRRR